MSRRIIMSVLHLRKGSKYPPLEPGVLRLYSMKYCPFSESTRLILAHKRIDYELVNIHLKDKPDWYFEKSCLGKTPCLEIDGKLIFDSVICNNYLEEVYPQNKLFPSDPYERAQVEMLIERYVSTVNSPYAYLCWTGADAEKLKDAQNGLEEFERILSDGRKYFGGKHLNMLDVRMWPMLEKADYIKDKTKLEILDPEKFPKLREWRANMFKTYAHKHGGTDLENLAKLKEGQDGILDYDVGVTV